jgi:hypothetical protein
MCLIQKNRCSNSNWLWQNQGIASLSRNIADFARLTPQAQLRGDDVPIYGGQITDIMLSILAP